MLNIGEILDGRYQIGKELGHGGYGAVYRAHDSRLGKTVALKENLNVSDDAARQFRREAEILANLKHPHLPNVTDHFSLPGKGLYLVMDFIEGENLQRKLQLAGGRLPESRVLKWVGQICNALFYLHTQDPPIIHRDIKPQNIIVDKNDDAMLVDFGLAKLYKGVDVATSTPGMLGKTPGFAPIEQYGTGITDIRTDVYSLGATIYVLLTGQVPPECVQRIPADTLKPPRYYNQKISEKVEKAVLKALSIYPTGRHQTVEELARQLDLWAAVVPNIQPINVQPAQPSQPQTVPEKKAVKSAISSCLVIIPVLVTLVCLFLLGMSLFNNVSSFFPITASPTKSAVPLIDPSNSNVVFKDDFSSYELGKPPNGWILRGAQTIDPSIVDFGGTGPNYQAVSFPGVRGQYWDKWLLKAGYLVSKSYVVKVKLNFQEKIADRAGITIAWDDTMMGAWDRISVQANAYNENIEFRLTYSGPIKSDVQVNNVGTISIVAGRNYWLKVDTEDNGPGNGKINVYWSTDDITYDLVVTVTGIANLTGLVGIGTAGPNLPNVVFDDFEIIQK